MGRPALPTKTSDSIATRIREGQPAIAIAKREGVSLKTVYRVATNHRLKFAERPLPVVVTPSQTLQDHYRRLAAGLRWA